ncbi:secreted protein [Candidatus Magnetomorum sp. HK-1]|nr:secreted protein [Candidatus Magnetomorum sp. HK-1]
MKSNNLFRYYIMFAFFAVFISAEAFADQFLVHPSSTQNQTQPISIPITLNNNLSADIMSIELEIGYDPNVLTATGISLTGTVLDNQDYLYVFNTSIPGTIYAIFASSTDIYTGTGMLLNLDFIVTGTAGETSDITIASARLNNYSATSSDGIFTVAPNAAPMFSNILPQTGTEDTPHTFTITVSDFESNPCDLTLTVESSDETLVSVGSISYTCISDEYYVTFSPSTNQSGNVSLTITTTDTGNLSSSTTVELTITSVNDPPAITSIVDQTTDEDVGITVTFTATDIETSPCGFSITLTSSNQSLFVDSNLTYVCQANSYTITLSPETNQSGMSTITVVAADSDGLTALTAFDITVTAINDAPQIGTIVDQSQFGSAMIEALELTATDSETSTCSLGMSVLSSNAILIPTSNISYTCTSNSFYFTLTPVTGQSGTSNITIVVTDSGGLTASTSFAVNINLPPELSNIPGVSTAVGEISFTFVEAEGDTVSLTITSSDQSLISDANILIIGGTGNITQLATTAEIAQSVSIQLTQENNVHGLATITVTASATGGSVSETFNVIVSPPGSGNSLVFDGDDDFVTFGSISGSHPLALAGSQFSMSFWIKPAFNNSVSQRLIDKSTNTYGTDGYSLYLYTGNRMKFSLNGLDRFTTDVDSLTSNIWQHVVITADTLAYKCYVNGMSVGLTMENAFELPPNATANLYLGTWYSEAGREYNGRMDEVSLWNKALSETEVRDIMCQRLTGSESGLLAYYRFDHISGTILTDLSGNDYHGTLTNMDNADWIISGAALGDNSTYDYTGSLASDFSVTLSHSDGDALTAFGDGGSYSGLHVYLINEAPSTYTAPAGFASLYTGHYFGVFPVGITPTYSIAYNYSGNTSIAINSGLRLASRSNNAGTWTDISALLDTPSTTLSQTGISAFSGVSTTEFIPGMNQVPIIGAISGQTINEDGIIMSLAITATDAETATCSLNITFNSSDTVLVPVDNISYTCSANIYYLTITPVSNLTGVSDITITLTDAGGLTASGILALTVSDVNDAPLVSTISNQTTIEDTAIGSISLTVNDIEDAPCSMDITITSSDSIMIPNNNISYTCTSNTYWLTITPAADQNGLATITFTVIDSGGLTAARSFDFTVTAVNDAPVLANPISNRIATEGNSYTYTIPSNTFTDVDSGDVLTYTATQSNGSALPGWLSFDPATRTFSGLPTNSDVASITITITATDGSAQSITDTFVLSVNNTNTAPVLDNPIVDQTISEDVAYSFTFAVDTFRDDDVAFGDTISYSAMLDDGSPLPTWLTFDFNNRNFSGTPLNADVGMITITVIAEDTLNLTAMDSFYLTVVNVNDAPEISGIVKSASVISITGLTIDEDANADAISFSITDVDDTNLTVSLKEEKKKGGKREKRGKKGKKERGKRERKKGKKGERKRGEGGGEREGGKEEEEEKREKGGKKKKKRGGRKEKKREEERKEGRKEEERG